MMLIDSTNGIYELCDEDYEALKRSKPKNKKHKGYMPLGLFVHNGKAIDNRYGYCIERQYNSNRDAKIFLQDMLKLNHGS